MSVRPVGPDDVDVVLGLVRELADYEKSLDEARMTRDQLHDALFGDSPACSGTSPATTGARWSGSRCGS